MNNADSITVHDECASSYDSQVKEYDSHLYEILFGMCYEYIKADDTLLDLGIGTGLSSFNFERAGLKVYGMDASAGMLKKCDKKGFAKELKQHSITEIPLPYSDNSFSHIICCGVFHFFGNILPTIKEVSRILKMNGIFAFTIASLTAKDTGLDFASLPEYIESPTKWGIPLYKHSDEYVNKIVETHGLIINKEQRILADSGDKDIGDILFKVFVAQRKV